MTVLSICIHLTFLNSYLIRLYHISTRKSIVCNTYNRHYEKVGNEVKDIADEIDFELPDGWEYIQLSTICWLDDIKVTSGEKLPYLDAKTLRGKSDKNYITSGKVIESGTKIILVDGENSGEVFDVPFRGYMGSTFKILGASDNINIDYLNIVLDFYRDVFKGNKIGAAIPHLNRNLFKSLLIGLPPIKEPASPLSESADFKRALRYPRRYRARRVAKREP